MNKPVLHIIKIGGNVIDQQDTLHAFVKQVSTLNEPFILVHGGGRVATGISSKLGITTHMVNGRRITDAPSLDAVVMVYAGLINKKIVALLQASGKNAMGLCGADANIIPATKRHPYPFDYGFVGDVNVRDIPVSRLSQFILQEICMVIAPITHDGNGQLLNTNADTIAASLAVALSETYRVNLLYCFEKNGVLSDAGNEQSVISKLDKAYYIILKEQEKIHSGMIPKLDNAFHALEQGVSGVHILHALQIGQLFKHGAGTKLVGA
jgi:acetylglutamate kinase